MICAEIHYSKKNGNSKRGYNTAQGRKRNLSDYIVPLGSNEHYHSYYITINVYCVAGLPYIIIVQEKPVEWKPLLKCHTSVVQS